MLTTDDIKVMLEVQQKAYKDSMEYMLSDVTSRLRQLEVRNAELIHSLEFTQQELDTLKNENKTLKEEITHLKEERDKQGELEVKLNNLNRRIDYQEDYSRRNNLRFDGLPEQPNETWEVTQEKIQRLLREKFDLGMVQLERAHRVGPKPDPERNRPRTIIARFAKFDDRQQALRNSAKLRNTNIYINEDLCESSMQARRAQIPDLRRAKAEGKIAFFSHTRLIIRDRRDLPTDPWGVTRSTGTRPDGVMTDPCAVSAVPASTPITGAAAAAASGADSAALADSSAAVGRDVGGGTSRAAGTEAVDGVVGGGGGAGGDAADGAPAVTPTAREAGGSVRQRVAMGTRSSKQQAKR